jgi:hypothetical protein
MGDCSDGGYLFTNAYHNSIVGGRVAMCSYAGDGVNSDIQLRGSSHHNSVVGVQFYEEVNLRTAKYAVEEFDTANYNSITGCVAVGQATGQWNLIGANSIKTGNVPT